MDTTYTTLLELSFLLLLALGVGDTLAICSYPSGGDLESLAGRASLVVETKKQSYETGDFVLFQCSKQASGFGFVKMECEEGATWSAPSRDCGDPITFGVSTLCGMFVAFSNLTIAVCVIVYSKVKYGPRAKILAALALAEEEEEAVDVEVDRDMDSDLSISEGERCPMKPL